MIDEWISTVSNIVWGIPTIVLILGTGILLTVRTKGLQFKKLGYALKLAFFSKEKNNGEGDVSNFEALMIALAATVGTGNIVGVATAIVAGGPGALFWMWMSALAGMVTKYAEAVLAVKYRIVDENGNMAGGPMYYLERGLHCKALGIAFSVFTVFASFGIGSGIQTNSMSMALQSVFGVAPVITGVVVFVLVSMIIIGGIHSISKVASMCVPAMILFYFGVSIIALILHFDRLPEAISLIFSGAFSPEAFAGGMAGAAIRYGIARGIFSNEAGLGSAPIAAAAAKTKHPCQQALVSMTQTFLDTIVICSMTGFLLIVGDLYHDGLNGAALTSATFNALLGPMGGYIVAASLILFAFSTVVGWSYYGEKSMQYLFGTKSILPYRMCFVFFATAGAVCQNLDTVWNLSDIFNGLMAIPNLIGLIGLSGVIVAETNSFLAILDKDELPEKAA